MIKFKSEIEEYEDRIRENISKLTKALKEEDVNLSSLVKDIFGCTCVNHTPVFQFNCMDLYCSECKKMFVRELVIKYGKKNNIKW
ncbi:MAG: hypothetical protein IIV48_07755 [Clostridium sp.]|nr:hypothetical protein [Clostridium sp.]